MIIKRPILTEKARELAKQGQYVFEVEGKANKNEIKKAIEEFFGVEVLSVRVLKITPKQRTLGRISGWKKGYKKAIVKIKKGQKIEVFE